MNPSLSSGRLRMDRAGTITRGRHRFQLAGEDLDNGQMLQMEVITRSEWDHDGRETILASTWIPVRAEMAWTSDLGRVPHDALEDGAKVLVMHVAVVGGRDFTRFVATTRMRFAWPDEGVRR